ncbi:MAG: hypothetical protein M1547_03115 [Gammaproteobacteria bacterium]|nr:hypothetical protein [Gammaproteobacteria bacterium]
MGAIRFILFFLFLLAAAVPLAVNVLAPSAAQVGGLAAWFTFLNLTGGTGEGGGIVGMLFSPKADPDQAARIHRLMGQAWELLFGVADWRFYLSIFLSAAVAAGVAGLLVKAMAARDRLREKGPQK